MHLHHLVAWLLKSLPYELVSLLVPSSPGIRRIGSSVGRAGQYKIRDGCQPRIWVLVGELSDWNKGNLPEINMLGIDPAFGVIDTTYCTLRCLFFCLLLAKVQVIVKDATR